VSSEKVKVKSVVIPFRCLIAGLSVVAALSIAAAARGQTAAVDEAPPAGQAAGQSPHQSEQSDDQWPQMTNAPALPRARGVDLKQVVPDSGPDAAPAAEAAAEAPANTSLVLLGSAIPPGTATRLAWSPSESFAGIAVPTPVLVINGAKPGKVLCLTAAIHGDELNGIEVVRRLMYAINPEKLSGSVIGVPIVNLQGFRRNSRYLPDRRDLNRYFPGNPRGSSAARIAHSFFHEVVLHCNALVDLHTGSFHRTNVPQLRADMTRPEVAALAQGFGATVVLHSAGDKHSLRTAAVEAGIPAVTLEAGEPMRLQEKVVNHGVQTIQNLLGALDMYERRNLWGSPEPIFYKSRWVRAGQGGILMGAVEPGQNVRKGQLLGTITDPITNARTEIRSPHDGRVLGMAFDQVVLPGFAAYRIGIKTTEDHVTDSVPAESGDAAAEPEATSPAGAGAHPDAAPADAPRAPAEVPDEIDDSIEDS
jgi:predicted deacylase